MTTPGPVGPDRNLIRRIRAILLRPEETWTAIAAEPDTGNGLYSHWVMPLAAIPSVCAFLGVLIFGGYQIASVGVRPTMATSVIEAIMSYSLTLVLVFVLAVVIELLAPYFGGARSRIQAFKLAAYSGTAFWLSGVFALYPSLGWPAAVLGGLYSLYTLNLGLPKLMRVDERRAIFCFALIIVAVLLLMWLKGAITAKAAELGGPIAAS